MGQMSSNNVRNCLSILMNTSVCVWWSQKERSLKLADAQILKQKKKKDALQ